MKHPGDLECILEYEFQSNSNSARMIQMKNLNFFQMDGIQGTLVRFKAKKTQQSFSVTLAKCINLTFSAGNTLIVKYLMTLQKRI